MLNGIDGGIMQADIPPKSDKPCHKNEELKARDSCFMNNIFIEPKIKDVEEYNLICSTDSDQFLIPQPVSKVLKRTCSRGNG